MIGREGESISFMTAGGRLAAYRYVLPLNTVWLIYCLLSST